MTIIIVCALVMNLVMAMFGLVHHVRAVGKIRRYRESLRGRRSLVPDERSMIDAEFNVLTRAESWNKSVAIAAGVVISINVSLISAVIVRAAI